jgi:DNA-binding MarR family transcriptional regulator
MMDSSTKPRTAKASPAISRVIPSADETLGLLLWDTQRAYQRLFTPMIGRHGVPFLVFPFLRMVFEHDGLTPGQLADAVHMTGSTTVVTLRQMERLGFVRRVKNDRDARKINIFLTDAGSRRWERVAPEVVAINRLAVKGMTKSDQRDLKRFLRAVRSNILAASNRKHAGAVTSTAPSKFKGNSPDCKRMEPADETLGFLFWDTQRSYQRIFTPMIARHGVSFLVFPFLRVTSEHEGLTFRELTDILHVRQPNSVVAIKEMERVGLVRREQNSQDARKVNLYLTEKGRRAWKLVVPEVLTINDIGVRGLRKEEQRSLKRLIRAARANILSGRTGENEGLSTGTATDI